MAIIIKEISIRTTVERTAVSSTDTDRKIAKLRRELLREMRESLRRQQQRKGER